MQKKDVDLAYAELMKRFLTRFRFDERNVFIPLEESGWKEWLLVKADGFLRKRNHAIVRIPPPTNWDLREIGRDWPNSAETMIGMARLSQLQDAIAVLVAENIEGDIVEAGVWRGGASIFMTALLNLANDDNRQVYVADSFEGLPPPSDEYPADAGDIHHKIDFLRVSENEVIDNFAKYCVSMDRVHIVKGWFDETLKTLPTMKIGLLRLDGDMYS